MKKNKNFFKAVATMIGYTIGVGMFGLPYIVAKAGILTFFCYLIVLGIIQYNIHLIYANMIIINKEYHRLPGFANIYLGKIGKFFAFAAKMIGNFGALLAYIIITGTFMFELLGSHFGGSEFMYGSIVFAIEAFIVYLGISMIAKVELFMSMLLFGIVIIIACKGSPEVDLNNYFLADWKYVFLPYGATLFALDGNGSLPIVAKLVKKDPKVMKKVIRTSMSIVVFIMVVFILTVVGISGGDTSPDALKGLVGVLDNKVITMAFIFGMLCMMTSVFGVTEAIKETLCWDFKLNKNLAWGIAVGVPYTLYLLGFNSLIDVIGFAGAIAGGLAATMLVIIFMKIKKKEGKIKIMSRQPSNYFAYLLIALFFTGMVVEIWSYFQPSI